MIGLVKGTAGGPGAYAYQYDYRTRRIVRDESAANGVVTALVFSGGTSVQEYGGSISSANLTVEYLRGSDYGGGVGGILYTCRGGIPSYTHENRRGDVVAKTDSTGSLTYQAQYQAFGQQVATTGSTLDRQKSNSKDTDPTNLVDEGFRYRDLETGEFITRDPAGFVDGPNLYTYVRQNPWTSFDPEGLTAMDRVEGYAQGVTNGLVGMINFGISTSVAGQFFSSRVPEAHNEGNATDRNDFANGELGGKVFFAGESAVVGGVGGAAAKGEVVVKGAEELAQGGAKTAEEAAAAAPKVPASPKPMESSPPGAQSAAATKGETDEAVTVYRGVASDHPGYSDALNGNATPRGGPSTPAQHNLGETDSPYTSWTTNKATAETKATTTQDQAARTNGVVLQDQVPKSQLVKSPDLAQEHEVLRQGPVTGAKATSVPKPPPPPTQSN